MNKLKKLAMIFGVALTFATASCGQSTYLVSIEITPYDKNVAVGDFDITKYSITENYSNGETKQVSLTEKMIDEVELLKTYQPGNQTLTINYLEKQIGLEITVARKQFDISMENKTVAYDGNPHSLDISGYIPNNASISYPYGESFTNVGVHEITAVVSYDNYETKTIKGTLTIEKSDIDMSAITFKDAEYEYDGNPHTIEIGGTLPEGVKVTYKIGNEITNSKTNAGTYVVTASFTSNNALNYNAIPDMTAVLTIKPVVCEFDQETINVGERDILFDGSEHEWVIGDVLPNYIDKPTYTNNKHTDVSTVPYVMVVHLHINNPNYCFENGKQNLDVEIELTISPSA